MLDFVIDNRTLFFICFIISGGMVVYLIAFSMFAKWSKAILALILGDFCLFLFFFMAYINALQPGFKLAVIVNFVEVLAVSFWVVSLKSTLSIELKLKRIIALNTIAFLSTLYFQYISFNLNIRRGITTFVMALLLIDGTIGIFKKYGTKNYKSFYFTGISMILFSIFKIYMTVYRFLKPVTIKSIFEPNESISLFMLVTLLFMLLINISFVFMNHDLLRSEILEMSEIDPLTQIYNRRYFMEYFESVLKKSRKKYALAILDLDDFKHVNDSYGHQSGDEVLYGFSTFLKERMRFGDLVARYGGEEFIILLEIDNSNEAVMFMDRIITDLKSIHWTDHEISMTFSGGLVVIDNNQSMETIIAIADERLYKAKEKGKKQVIYS